jgi:hypothetical protein
MVTTVDAADIYFRSPTITIPDIVRVGISTNHLIPQAALKYLKLGHQTSFHFLEQLVGLYLYDIDFDVVCNDNIYSGFDLMMV